MSNYLDRLTRRTMLDAEQERDQLLDALERILDGLSPEAWDSLNTQTQLYVMAVYDKVRGNV